MHAIVLPAGCFLTSTVRSAAGKIGGQSSGKTFSSIPSKFETTLFTGNKERDGFGSRAHRFVDLENDLPGPGAYEDKRLQDEKVYSKKGLGVGFVSKTKRQSAFATKATAPGPGSYRVGYSISDLVQERNRANVSGSTGTFEPPTTKSVGVSSDPTPGPGNYEVVREFSSAAASAARQAQLETSAFRSGTQRGGVSAAQRALPAPGQYDPRIAASTDDNLPSAAFRSTVPIVGQAGHQRLTREQALGVVPAAPQVEPGPGAYEPPIIGSSGIRRRMPQFCESNHDRFGRSLDGSSQDQWQVPGPGSYLKDEPRHGAPISGAVFMSGTNRSSGMHEVVPGPAYYSPAPTGKKSYHLNARSRWMPA